MFFTLDNKESFICENPTNVFTNLVKANTYRKDTNE